ncbi:uncharacterized protein AB9W97_005213 isoform 1-T1 [Spinachia spinachia]
MCARVRSPEPTRAPSMPLKSNRGTRGLGSGGLWRRTHRLLLVIWLLRLAATAPRAGGYFLGDTKAVLNGCEEHWTLQDSGAVPSLFQMTLCVDVRVVAPGAWVAFSYTSAHTPSPELGLEGDDEALYGWLLRVRHRFPIRLSPGDWHRVCLRRDVQRNSFSLEVNGTMVDERTVLAEATPPSGSLWLGCSPRDRPPGAVLGGVELYLFRAWADMDPHGPCEDGTVIGWSARYWGVTSPAALQRDSDLQCDHRQFGGRLRAYRSISDAATDGLRQSFSPSASAPSTTATWSPDIPTHVTEVSRPTALVTESSLLNCNVHQLCSNDTDAYFWMSISVEATGGNGTEQDVYNLVSNAFGCHNGNGLCLADAQLQAVMVNCSAKSNIRQTSCDVLLQLGKAVPACSLQQAAGSALQQAADQQLRATITRQVERVGRDVCGNAESSSGGFVRCTSTSSLDDICLGNKPSEITCSLIEPHSNPAPQPQSESCSSEGPRFCNCTAFCSSKSQFFGSRIYINSASVKLDVLQQLLSGLPFKCNTLSNSECRAILQSYQRTHLQCQGTQQR